MSSSGPCDCPVLNPSSIAYRNRYGGTLQNPTLSTRFMFGAPTSCFQSRIYRVWSSLNWAVRIWDAWIHGFGARHLRSLPQWLAVKQHETLHGSCLHFSRRRTLSNGLRSFGQGSHGHRKTQRKPRRSNPKRNSNFNVLVLILFGGVPYYNYSKGAPKPNSNY